MQDCLTKPIMTKYSGCLVKNPACDFATPLGFSYLCGHPRHKDFHPDMVLSGHQIDHNALYDGLRESRRREYISRVKALVEGLENQQGPV